MKQRRRGKYAVTWHAKERLRQRWGIILTLAQWSVIIQHTRAGAYQRDSDGHVLVPMGDDPLRPFYVPMAVDIQGRVITVLPRSASPSPGPDLREQDATG